MRSCARNGAYADHAAGRLRNVVIRAPTACTRLLSGNATRAGLHLSGPCGSVLGAAVIRCLACRLARGKDAWVRVLLTVHERLQLQHVVDAEQQRGRRPVQHDEVAAAAAAQNAAASQEGSHERSPRQDREAAGGTAQRKTRARAGGGCGKRSHEGMAGGAECGSRSRRPKQSMGSRLRDQLHALTGEPQ